MNVNAIPNAHTMNEPIPQNTNPLIAKITKNWLEKNNIKYNELFLGHKDKRKIIQDNNIEVFIDDSLKTCMEIYEMGIKTLIMDSRINKNMPIEHIGSTILPNMYGKNIIDILVGVNEENEMDKYSDILIELGYFPGNHNSGNYRFFASTKKKTKMGDVHIHLVYINSDRYRDFITLRDYLLSNKEERKAYSDLKRKLISDGTNIREDYKVTKSKYVSDLLIRARKYMKNNY